VATIQGLSVETVDDPVPARGQILVASKANGICGSDLHLIDSIKSNDAPRRAGPIIPGHEFCAEVVDYGPNTDAEIRRRFPTGTLVCANPFVGDGRSIIGGTPSYPGGLGELMVLDIPTVLAVPEGMPPERAALTEPLAVGIRAVAAARRATSRGPYLVIGCGPIGLAVILALRVAGLGPIVASDMAPTRRKLAQVIGADVVVDATSESPFSHLDELGFKEGRASPMFRESSEPEGPVVFECVGLPGVFKDIIEKAPRHSHVVVVGVCLQPDSFLPGLAVVRELSVDFVLAYRPDEFEMSLQRIATGVVDPSPLVTKEVALDQVSEAIDALRRGDHGKILVRPSGQP
jgi:threonine dehydrogenase-like Zn-dependent dehydrogenase